MYLNTHIRLPFHPTYGLISMAFSFWSARLSKQQYIVSISEKLRADTPSERTPISFPWFWKRRIVSRVNQRAPCSVWMWGSLAIRRYSFRTGHSAFTHTNNFNSRTSFDIVTLDKRAIGDFNAGQLKNCVLIIQSFPLNTRSLERCVWRRPRGVEA